MRDRPYAMVPFPDSKGILRLKSDSERLNLTHIVEGLDIFHMQRDKQLGDHCYSEFYSFVAASSDMTLIVVTRFTLHTSLIINIVRN